jgi:hypothetical protein
MPREISNAPEDVWSRNRRIRNSDNGRCINENKQGTHGHPVPGHVRCQPCIDVHKKSK